MPRENPRKFVAFPTDLGWLALVGRGTKIERVVRGYPSRAAIFHALGDAPDLDCEDMGAWPQLVARLQDYAGGGRADFRDVALDLDHLTPFQRRVIKHCRAIRYGATSSYGSLASAAGSPGAARAVGSTMAGNRFPLIVPCHRVINSDGTIGNYSGGDGVRTKVRLLKLERADFRPPGRKQPAPRAARRRLTPA